MYVYATSFCVLFVHFLLLLIEIQSAIVQMPTQTLRKLGFLRGYSNEEIAIIQPKLNSNFDVARYQLSILEKNKKFIEEHNSQQNITYKMGLNQFALATTDQLYYYLSLFNTTEKTVQFATYQQKPVISEQSIEKGVNYIFSGNPIKTLTNFGETPQQTQTQILAQVRRTLEQRNFSQEQIQLNLQRFARNNPSSKNRLLVEDLPLDVDPSIYTYIAEDRNIFVRDVKIDNLSEYNVDWTCIAGPIRNQGPKCGSCYAFAATDTFSMVMAIYKYGFFVPMSTQVILQCPKNSLTFGCAGGFLQGSYLYMLKQGLMNEIWYPYSKQTFQKSVLNECKQFKTKKYKIRNFYHKLYEDCNAMRIKLKDQPLAIAVSAKPMLFYKEGVFNGCSNDQINHAVVLIGYKAGVGWKIKNSWGTSWGQNGYAWIADGNMCRICEIAFAMQPEDEDAFANLVKSKMRKSCPSS